MNDSTVSTRRLTSVARRTAAAGLTFWAALCLTGSAFVAGPVDLQWLQPNAWPSMSESDDPEVNCGIEQATDVGACVIENGAAVVVSTEATEDQGMYIALAAVAERTFEEAGVKWDQCDVSAWALVHGATQAAADEFGPSDCD